MNRLIEFDLALNSRYVAGTDEAGRGCLAGPIVAAAVRFDCDWLAAHGQERLAALDDSKKKTAKARELLYAEIVEHAAAIAIAVRGPIQIDLSGVHRANLSVLGESLAAVVCEDCVAMVDGFSVPQLPFEHRSIKRGDSTSAAIAAASVIAKVTRDRYMADADLRYPGWGFAQHAGYGTKDHCLAIEKQGITPLHRLSFNATVYEQIGISHRPPQPKVVEQPSPALKGSAQMLEPEQFQIFV